jgi:hypothetical protein
VPPFSPADSEALGAYDHLGEEREELNTAVETGHVADGSRCLVKCASGCDELVVNDQWERWKALEVIQVDHIARAGLCAAVSWVCRVYHSHVDGIDVPEDAPPKLALDNVGLIRLLMHAQEVCQLTRLS